MSSLVAPSLPAAPWAPGGAQADAMVLGPRGAEAMPEGGALPGHGSPLPGLAAADAVLPGARADAELRARDAARSGLAESAPWGNPADELAAGGQHLTLAELARDAARSGMPTARTGDAPRHDERLAAEAPRAEAAAPEAGLGTHVDANMPASPLVPLILTALHSGPAAWRWRAPEDTPRRARHQPAHDDEDEPAADPAASEGDEANQADRDAAPVARVVESLDEPAWCPALVEVLRRQAREPAAQAALQLASTTWLRGRAVLLACPASAADAAAGWLFVLRRREDGEAGRSVLAGERFAARLRWTRSPEARQWWAVRVAKRHAWPRGVQLVTLDEGGGAPACEVQLGPIAAPFARWRDVLVRVDAAQRLWAALGVQWSLPLLVCSEALLAEAGMECQA